MPATLVLTGHKDLDRKLKRLAGPDQKKAVRKAARLALRPVKAAARSGAPRRTGALAKGITIRSITRSRGRVGAKVTAGQKTVKGAGSGRQEGKFSDHAGDYFYGALQEFGWKVGKRRSKAKGFTDKRRQIPGKGFMAAAAQQKRSAAVQLYRTELARVITEIAQKAAGSP